MLYLPGLTSKTVGSRTPVHEPQMRGLFLPSVPSFHISSKSLDLEKTNTSGVAITELIFTHT